MLIASNTSFGSKKVTDTACTILGSGQHGLYRPPPRSRRFRRIRPPILMECEYLLSIFLFRKEFVILRRFWINDVLLP